MSALDFPDNVVDALAARLVTIAEVDVVLKRPLRPTDPSGSVGVFAVIWSPSEYEIGQHDPAVTRYSLNIQTFIKHGDEQEGITLHSRLAKRVRVMLYRDDALRVLLGSLSVTDAGNTERLQRWGIETQRYLSNEMEGTFLYLAVTDMWVETEVV
jgi:hypothetical protein